MSGLTKYYTPLGVTFGETYRVLPPDTKKDIGSRVLWLVDGVRVISLPDGSLYELGVSGVPEQISSTDQGWSSSARFVLNRYDPGQEDAYHPSDVSPELIEALRGGVTVDYGLNPGVVSARVPVSGLPETYVDMINGHRGNNEI